MRSSHVIRSCAISFSCMAHVYAILTDLNNIETRLRSIHSRLDAYQQHSPPSPPCFIQFFASNINLSSISLDLILAHSLLINHQQSAQHSNTAKIKYAKRKRNEQRGDTQRKKIT